MFRKIIMLMVMGLVLTGCLHKKDEEKSGGKESSKLEEFSGSLKEAMGLAVPMKCTFKQNGNVTTSYVKGSNFYVETVTEGKTGFVLSKDNCTWTWGGDEAQGMKLCYEPEEVEVDEATEVEKAEFKAEGVNYEMDYKCAPAVFGDEKFSPPTDIEFMSMEEMMKGMLPAGMGQ